MDIQIFSKIHSAGETQRATRRKSLGWVRRSQRSLAGRMRRAACSRCVAGGGAHQTARGDGRILGAARVGPGEDGRERFSRRGRAEQAVPETGAAAPFTGFFAQRRHWRETFGRRAGDTAARSLPRPRPDADVCNPARRRHGGSAPHSRRRARCGRRSANVDGQNYRSDRAATHDRIQIRFKLWVLSFKWRKHA